MSDAVTSTADAVTSTADAPAVPASRPVDLGRVRRWGWWYFAEQRVRAMPDFLTTMLLMSVGTPVFYILAFGMGLALVVDQANPGGLDGVSYLAFLAPALLLSGSMLMASEDATFGVFGGFKWNPIVTAASQTPISAGQIVAGYLVSFLIKCAPAAIVFLILMAIVGAVPAPTAPLILLVDALLILAVGAPVMAFVATQRDDRGQLSLIQRFVMTPLMLFSGTYFPLEALPGWLQWIGWISPLWHAVDLGRAATYGRALDPALMWTHLAVLAAFAIVGMVLAVRIFSRRVVS